MRWTSTPLVLGTAFWAGCTGSPATEPPAGSIDEYLQSLPALPSAPSLVVEGQRTDDVREGDYSCNTTDLTETRQYDKVVAYNTNSESLWPGAIIAGESVYTGEFRQQVFARQPLTVSVSLENLAGAKSAAVVSPSLSATREAITGILDASVSGATPANIYTEIEKVSSQKQLGIALGADVSWLGSVANIGASFHFDDSTVKSRYVVKYTQSYYTVDVDQPSRPSDFFAASVSLGKLRDAFADENPPLYVSSITYGRMVVFTVESEHAGVEVDAALRFAYSGGVDVSGNTSVTYKDIIESSKITAFILGGSGGDAARNIDSYEGLMEFIKSGGDYSRQSPGAPIAYKLAYLSDNAPARLSFTTEYQLKDCERVSQRVKATLKSIAVVRSSDGDTSGDTLEVFGKVTLTGESAVTLFELSRNEPLRLREGTTFPTDGRALAESIVQVLPNQDGTISILADMLDQDDAFGDDDLNPENRAKDAPFELGWRRDVDVLLTGAGAEVKLTIELQPI
jgi:thiol-activated cytolysin